MTTQDIARKTCNDETAACCEDIATARPELSEMEVLSAALAKLAIEQHWFDPIQFTSDYDF